MNAKNKKLIAWGFVITLIVASVTVFKGDKTEEETVKVEVVWPNNPTQVEILTEDLEEEILEPTPLKDSIEEEILHFTDEGMLIAPYPDYESFGEAFAFGKLMLGDSSEHGSLRVFMWRGNLYNTETLKQSSIKEVVVDTIDTLETVVNDTIK
jgi:hypothetical protein